ncbi:MAG TPA: alcohol dehydrogenase catalytic domain-containing protein, partial [Actinomycetota bacterium]|nr:alcohol dehydrogenase catalytic domain-containing protein [Actinomycetota bacterium]
LVRIVASGVCHSDIWAIEHGNWGEPFPMMLGHEGSGIVEEVGELVTNVEPGDPVLLAWAVPCGTCAGCARGEPRACAHAWSQPPRVRIARTGASVKGTLSLGTLATHTVVHAAQVIRVPDGVDLSRICLLGCGASTGVGAVVHTAMIRPGATVAVIGIGGIGLSAVQGARIAGAARIIAVDLVPPKLEVARAVGATDVVDAGARDAVEAVRDLTDGVGVEAAFEATGVAAVVEQAVAMLTRGGVAVAIGVPTPESEITLPWGAHAYPNKIQLRVTDGGDALPEDFLTWMEWFRDGRLDLDALVTREARLTEDDIAEAFRAMLAGEVLRTVIRLPDPGAPDPPRAD